LITSSPFDGPAAVLRGRHTHLLLEPAAECAEIREPHELGDLADGQVGGSEQIAGTLDPGPTQVLRGRLAVCSAEGADGGKP
jgi:hypothetical protein